MEALAVEAEGGLRLQQSEDCPFLGRAGVVAAHFRGRQTVDDEVAVAHVIRPRGVVAAGGGVELTGPEPEARAGDGHPGRAVDHEALNHERAPVEARCRGRGPRYGRRRRSDPRYGRLLPRAGGTPGAAAGSQEEHDRHHNPSHRLDAYPLAGPSARQVELPPVPRVLVTEEIAERGLDGLRAAGCQVDVRLELSPDDLLDAVKGADA